MILTGGEALVDQLIREGVKDVFGIPGMQLDWAVDALRTRADKIRFIVPRHEQATSYMADGYARSTGREGVCMVVPGPGMLNALAGLATAYACNSRVLFISGQIPSGTIGRKFGQLHEIPDQSGILKSLTKWHGIAKTAEEIPALVHEAFVQLRQGQPRPVGIEVPPDFLQSKVDVCLCDAAPYRPMAVRGNVSAAVDLLRQAKFPVIYAGGGALAARAAAQLAALSEKLQAPVVMSENGRGALSDHHPMALTALGGRSVLPHADVVLVAGSRFLTAIATPVANNPDCHYIYLNTDADMTEAPRPKGMLLQGDVASGLSALLQALVAMPDAPSRAELVAKVKDWAKAQCAMVQPQADYAAALRAALPDDGILVSELTQVGYYSNAGYPVLSPGSYIYPGYQGTLGYGFPTALGVAAGNPGKKVISINGDGGFGWALQELATARRYNLNLSVIVFCDGQFGNVRRMQKQSFGTCFATELTNPDYALLAQAFGIAFAEVSDPKALAAVLAAHQDGPELIVARVGEMDTPWPLLMDFVPPQHQPPKDPLAEGIDHVG